MTAHEEHKAAVGAAVDLAREIATASDALLSRLDGEIRGMVANAVGADPGNEAASTAAHTVEEARVTMQEASAAGWSVKTHLKLYSTAF